MLRVMKLVVPLFTVAAMFLVATASASAETRPILYWGYDGKGVGAEVYIADSDGGNERLVREGNLGASLSPDSKWIALAGDEEQSRFFQTELSAFEIQPIDGKNPIIFDKEKKIGDKTYAYAGEDPVWSPDGSQVAAVRYVLNAKKSKQLWYERVVCTVQSRSCKTVGVRKKAANPSFVGWRAADGLIELNSDPRFFNYRKPKKTLPRCGKGATQTSPSWQGSVAPVTPSPAFPKAIPMVGPSSFFVGEGWINAANAADATVLVDYPSSGIKFTKVKCNRSKTRIRFKVNIDPGVARIRLHRAGQLISVPSPPEFRRGQVVSVAPSTDGSVYLIAGPVIRSVDRATGYVMDESELDVEDLDVWSVFNSKYDGLAKVWRYTPGSNALTPVTTLSRTSRKVLGRAAYFGVASKDDLVASSGIETYLVPTINKAPIMLDKVDLELIFEQFMEL